MRCDMGVGVTMIHADTDGLLDRCHCGAVAGFDAPYSEAMEVRVRCTECCEQTNWFPTADGASCYWNIARRAEKGKKAMSATTCGVPSCDEVDANRGELNGDGEEKAKEVN